MERAPDRILYQSDLATIGEFRCPTSHPMFGDSGPIRESCIVFPRTAVVIQHEGEPPFVADPSLATIYNGGQRYHRRAISADGDRCDWYAIAPGVVREAVRRHDPGAADRPDRVLRHSYARVDAKLYLEQRQLFEHVRGTDTPDAIAVEETAMMLLDRVLHCAYRDTRRAPNRLRPRASRQRRDLVEAARAEIGRRFARRLSLSEIASAVETSPFHLCRAFREIVGSSVHKHLTTIRLRSALEQLRGGGDLSRVALDAGFSSHSHFSSAFAHAFGVVPSRALRTSAGLGRAGF